MQQWYQCPNCSAPVAFGARFCANCGTPLSWPTQQQTQPPPAYQQQQQPRFYGYQRGKPEQKRTNPWLIGCLGLVGFVILVGGAVLAVGIGSREKPSTAPPSGTTAPSPGTTEKVFYSVGQDVIVGKARWRVLSARDRGSVLKASESLYPMLAKDKVSTGRFIEVAFEVENIGEVTEDFVSAPTVLDSKDREFESAEGCWDWIPDEKRWFLPKLPPGVRKQFIEIYEVSQDATGLKLKIRDISVSGTDTAFVGLGL